MGWLSRNKRPADVSTAPTAAEGPALSTAPNDTPEPVPAAPGPTDPQESAAPPAPAGPESPQPAAPRELPGPQTPMGRYGPLVSITRFEAAPPELEWQLPINGELYRLMPGSDRPDYSLLVLDRPLHFYPKPEFDMARVEPEQRVEDRKGRPMARVHAMLLCARYVGQQLHPGMVDLAVNLAYVIDNSLARDAEVDFGKIEFAAVGLLSEGHAPRPAAAQASPAATGDAEPDSRHTVEAVLEDLGRQLHAGIEAKRGEPVHRLTAALKVGPDHRLRGLSGNADGQAPVPTEETFARLNSTLARLDELGAPGRVAAVTVRVEGGEVSHEVTATHD